MRKSWLSLLLLVPALLQQACATPARSPDERVWGTLELVSTEPPLDKPLNPDLTVVSTLRYSIRPFREGQFFITPQFDKTPPGTTTDSSPLRQRDYPSLKTASGEVEVVHWLGYPWADPRVTRPLRLRYYLHRRTGPGSSEAFARTEPMVLEVRQQ